jgi:hypothetical protein
MGVDDFIPMTNDFQILYYLKRKSRELYRNTLFRKGAEYTASVVSTLAKLNKRTIVLSTTPIISSVFEFL